MMETNSVVLRWGGFLLLSILALLPFGPGSIGGVTRPDSPTGIAVWTLLALLFGVAATRLARAAGVKLGLQRHPGWVRNLGLGLAWGTVSYLTGLGIMFGLGRYAITGLSWSAAAILSMAVGAGFTALSEELVFRGYLVQIMRGWSPSVIVMVTALLFVALHLPRWREPWPYFAGLFFKGIFYAIPALSTGSIWASMGHHWSWNFTYYLFFGYERIFLVTRVAPVGGSVSLWVALGLALTAPLFARLLRGGKLA